MKARKRAHSVMMFTLLVALGSGSFWWLSPPASWGRSGFFGHVADVLDYVLPDLLGGLVEYAVIQHPIYITVVAVVGLGIWIDRTRVVKRMRADREELRAITLAEVGVLAEPDAPEASS